MKKIKKLLSALLIILLLFAHPGFWVVLAEEVAPSPPQTEQQVNNDAQVSNNVDSTAITGENSISEPTPTPEPESQTTGEPEVSPSPTPDPEATPTPTPVVDEVTPENSEPPPTPTPTPEIEIDNSAQVANDIDSTAITGENSIEQPSPSSEPTDEPEATESATIDTGDAVSVVEAENSVNSAQVNSQVVYHTLNIFVSQEGDIDLATTALAIADMVFDQNNNNTPVVNVAVLDNNNFAYLTNDITSLASTGNNSIEGAQEAAISTGDAYSIVTLFNQVNTTIIDSTIHLVTINIFGTVEGNILLPEFEENGGSCCGGVTQVDNNAQVSNNVSSQAVSGQNSAVSSESASITTGNAQSTVNLVNIVNTNLINMIFYRLFINNFGSWSGNFLGWDNFGPQPGGGSLSLNSTNAGGNGNGNCPTCVGTASIGNQAYVINNVSSTASTGGNFINGGNANITTGNAYSAVSIINFINTNISRSIGFFGFINIFGFFNGDIGGASLFEEIEESPQPPEPESEPEGDNSTEPGGPSVRDTGGLLEITQDHNVGAYVLPGDTVTFFETVKNTGNGRVYDVKLRISLIKDGVDMGGAIFNLGDIGQGKGVKVTTGLVLSEDAEPGTYLAQAKVWGYVGPGSDEVLASEMDTFLIGGLNPLVLAREVVPPVEAAADEEGVLGTGTVAPSSGLTREQKLWLTLLGLMFAYSTTKAIQKRKRLAVILSPAAVRSWLVRFASFLS